MIIQCVAGQGINSPPLLGYTDHIIRKKIGFTGYDITKKGIYKIEFIFEDSIKLETWELPNVKNR